MDIFERQRQRETDTIRDGAVKWCKSFEYHLATDTKPVRNLVGQSLDSLSEAILAVQQALKSGTAKLPPYAVPLLSLRHDILALVTLTTQFNMISETEYEECASPRVTPVAYAIGQWCRIERIRDLSRGRAVDVVEELLQRSRNRYAAKHLAVLSRVVDDKKEWAKTYRSYHLGEKLISLAIEFARFNGQPIFELQTENESYGQDIRRMRRIGLTEAAQDWIASQTPDAVALFSPLHLPMLVPPLPWTSPSDGGYVHTRLDLLKRPIGNKAQKYFDKANMTAVYSAVNALQNTGYRINQKVYLLMRKALEMKLAVFLDDADEDTDPVQRARELKRMQMMMTLRLAQAGELANEARFYYPYQLDHRGRAYPIPQSIHPQSNHIGRSLIEFDEGKPLGERGAYNLAIHLANCYFKGEKGSFAKRLAWVHEHEAEIIDFATDPLRDHRFWHEADKPWMFVAACIDWQGYREHGPEYCSHLAISVDGSCNGYQHLSAMARDPDGGRATNLTASAGPADDPADIYIKVRNLVESYLRHDADDSESVHNDLARQLVGRITRKLAKPPTMTTPYGVTRRTIYQDLYDSKLLKSCKDRHKCADYLARLFEECVREVAVASGLLMSWFRDDVTEVLAKSNRVMMWTSAVGFPVVHASRKQKAVRLATADHKILVYQEDEKQKIDVRKQEDGVVAHFVHSQDAAHMMLTTNRLHVLGLRHFAMVHDSYGVHACDVDLLNRVLREEFVGMYSEPVLQKFTDELRRDNPDIHLPDPPAPGTLDIRQVLSSLYFFA